MMFDAKKIRADFPILAKKIHGKKLVYLDSAATSQKPKVVIDALVDYYENHNANVHRGIHTLGDESTKMYHEARAKVAKFLGAQVNELVFVRNTTEAINLVAQAWARENLRRSELVVTSELEHHSDLVVWQEVVRDTGTELEFVEVTKDGQIDLDDLEMMLEKKGAQVSLLAFAYVSNATGGVLDVGRVVKLRNKYTKGAKILLDAAQVVPHMGVNFGKLGVDFSAFSGHKMYGPMGIGGLLVKRDILEKMGPFMVGGGMIDEVNLEGASFADLPDRFDAGTPNVAGAVGLAAACDYLSKLGMKNVERHGSELVDYALEKLQEILEVEVVGPRRTASPSRGKLERLGSVAFTYKGVHAHDVAQILDSEGIAVRSGHHCTMPLHKKFKWVATTRASFGVYNTKDDIDRLVEGLEKVKKVFGKAHG